MSTQDGRALRQHGTVSVMLGMALDTTAPVRVQTEALLCLGKLVSRDTEARAQLLDMGGLEYLFNCRLHAQPAVQQHAIDVIQGLLLPEFGGGEGCGSEVKRVLLGLDRFSDFVLVGLCGFMTVSPSCVAESAVCERGDLRSCFVVTHVVRAHRWS